MVLKSEYYGKTIKHIELENFRLSLTKYDAEINISTHFHGNPYLSLLLNGNYLEKGHKNTQTITKGNLVFRPESYPHANEFFDETNYCFNIEFMPSYYSQHFNTYDFKVSTIVTKLFFNEIFQLYYKFINDYPSDIINLHVYEAIQRVLDQNSKKSHGRAIWVNKIMELIKEEPGNNYSIEKLAEQFHLHPIYLVRKFKEKTGYKLFDFIKKARLEKAINEIHFSDDNLTKISYKCGFYDQSHFSKAFKFYFGISPSKSLNSLKG